MDFNEAKLKAARYCSYQERATFEVESKLKSFGLENKQIKKVLAELTDEGYINESRFSRIFAHGKFRNNKWGKIKIRQHLILKHVPEDDIVQGLSGIPEDEYMEIIKKIVEQKIKSIDDPDIFIRNNKVAAFLVQKGFESELVWEALKNYSDV